jgi:hypothetical protein
VAFNQRLARYGRASVVTLCALLAVAAMPAGEMAAVPLALAAIGWCWLHL